MNRFFKAVLVAVILFVAPLTQWGQQPSLIKVSEFNVSNLESIEERVFVIHSIIEKGYYCYKSNELPNTVDVYVTNDASDELSDFDFFYDNLLYNDLVDFSYYDKTLRGELFVQWRMELDDNLYSMLYEDFTKGTPTRNASCETADPFCSNIGTYDFPAGVNSGSPCGSSTTSTCSAPYYCYDGHNHPGYGITSCLSTAPNPAFYYLKIGISGNLDIKIYSSPRYDIDFDCWGPFDDIEGACDLLSCNNIVDCSYQGGSEDEHCYINNAQAGQYYILLLTNYGNHECNIIFENIGGGATDCGILPGYASNDGPYCVGDNIQLSINEQEGASYSWVGPNNFSSTLREPTINNCTMANAGTYTCTVTVDTLTVTGTTEVLVYANPVASFTSDVVCSGTPTHFTSTSTTSPTGYSIDGYQWSFGDGQSGTGQNPTHSYAAGGTYQVTLTVNCGGVCTDEITQTVTVNASPTVNAGPDQTIAYGSSTQLNGSGGTGNFTYQWTPENMINGASNIANPQTVNLTATQTYTLTMTNPDHPECNGTDQVTIYINGGAMTVSATANPASICAGSSTQLSANAGGGTGNFTYSWSPTTGLSNPNISNPTASPTQTTTYTCTVSDGQTTQTATVTVTVNPVPVPSFTFTSACEGSATQFTNTSTGQNIISYYWEFGDGGNSTEQNPSHTYAQAGSYQVTLTIVASAGNCANDITQTVTVSSQPTANFTFTTVCSGTATQFNSTATGTGINSYQWNFGDGQTGSGQNVSHTYAQPGTYQVTHTVGASSSSCTDQITYSVTVNEQPTANFNATTECSGNATQFNSTAVGQGITNYQWNFGDGQTGNGQNVNHTYAQPGTYQVTHTVSTTNGDCSDAVTQSVTVYPQPTCNFTYTSVCSGTPTDFTSTSTGQGITGYQWNFGDGHTGTGQNVSHTYAQAGNYQVTHTVLSSNGECDDQLTQTVPVSAMPAANAGPDQTITYGSTAQLSGSGGAGTFNFHWEPANMVVNPNSQNTQTIALTNSQTYTLTVTNPQTQQCTETDQVTIHISGSNMTVTVSPNASICQGGSTTIQANAGGGTGNFTYSWTPTTGLSNPSIYNPIASPMVTTTYTCTVSDGQTTQTVSTTVSVNDVIIEHEYASMCPGDSYPWYGNTYYDAGEYEYSTITPEGCEETIYLHLDLYPEYNDSPVNAAICHGETYYFSGNSYTETGLYTVNLQTIHGCDSIVTLNLNVWPENETIIDSISICESQTLFWHGNYYNQNGQTAVFDTIDNHGCPLQYRLALSVGQYQTGSHTVAYECYPNGGTPYYLWAIPEQGWSRAYYQNAEDQVILPDPNGNCDILYSLSLTFMEEPDISITDTTVCNSYKWYVEDYLVGEYFETTEDEYHIPLTNYPCDKVYQLHLTVNQQSIDNEVTIECNNLENPTCNTYSYSHPYLGDTVFVFTRDIDTVLTGETPEGCDFRLNFHLRNLKFTPHPYIKCSDGNVEFPDHPITATEFNVNRYTYHIEDNVSDISTWIMDSCSWSISKPSWPIVPSDDKLSCIVYAMDWIPDSICLSFKAVNACADTIAQYWLKPSFYGIEEQEAYPAAVNVFPNPNKGQMQLRFENMTGDLNIKVYNMSGALIDSFDLKVLQAGDTYDYSMRRLQNGVYGFVISDGKRSVTKKVVIIR